MVSIDKLELMIVMEPASKTDDPGQALDDIFDDYISKYGINSTDMVDVFITCPFCGKSKIIPIDKGLIGDLNGRMMEYAVLEGVICEHEFIIAIDSNFVAR